MSASESLFDFLRPRYPEAVTRLRNSIIALVFLTIATHLLPTPGLPLALYKFMRSSYTSSLEKGTVISGLPPSFVPANNAADVARREHRAILLGNLFAPQTVFKAAADTWAHLQATVQRRDAQLAPHSERSLAEHDAATTTAVRSTDDLRSAWARDFIFPSVRAAVACRCVIKLFNNFLPAIAVPAGFVSWSTIRGAFSP
ncbi:hypothetical protein K488DRAFT_90485 [Vararia minispora EC-137]|uniref:Uncharacterized protein n=1 Tax=Vararia minispora EC-137 TaxID=1314806 RepID=A0ACB8Q7Y0_9AGAM|nr:hypothetical protein K488DRAFT_90485 [Vararia minispora EC-137]